MTLTIPVPVFWFTAGVVCATAVMFGMAWWSMRRRRRG